MNPLTNVVDRVMSLAGFERRPSPAAEVEETKAVEIEPALWNAINGGWGLPTKSGSSVSTDAALQLTPFYRAMLVIAEGIAQLPVQIYKKVGKGAELADEHPLFDMLRYQPNLLQDSFQYFRTTLMHAAGGGMGVSYKNVVGGVLKELIPIRPESCQVEFDQFMQRHYWISFEQGEAVRVRDRDVFVIAGPSWNLRRPLDPSVVGREAIGLARTLEGTQAALHKNGTRPSGVLQTDQKLDQAQVDLLRETWQSSFGGESKTGSTPVVGSGLKWQQAQFNSVDSQTLESRKLQIEEVGRLMGVFTIMLGHAGDQSPTFASADAFFAAHVRYTLMPWIKGTIAAVDTQLLTKEERREGYHCRIDTSELLRGSPKDRSEYYVRALGTNNSPGWLSPAEVREDDGWNPGEGEDLDKIYSPLSMTTKPESADKPEADPEVVDKEKPETKAAARTLFVSRKLLNTREFLTWAKAQGFKKPQPADEMHVTITFSKRAVDWMTMGDPWSMHSRGELIVPAGGARLVEPIGKEGAVALLFTSSELSWRHREMIEAGASSDWPDYQPHVTITWDAEGMNLKGVEPYRGELRFGPEIFAEIDDNWRTKATGDSK